MKALRNFILSLAAVFLALAVGVVVGARVLSGPMVSTLRGDKGDLQRQNTELTEKLTAAEEFAGQMSSRMVRDSLAGKSVLLFRTPDADDGDVESLSRLVGQAGGSVTGTIGLTNEFVDGNAGEKLRSIVNSPVLPAGTQLNAALTDPASQAGDLLGVAVLINRDPKLAPVGDSDRETVLIALRDTGFLTYDRVSAADTAVIVTGGGLAEDAGNRGATVARLAAGMAPHGSGTVLAGREGSATGVSAVALARSDAALGSAVSTVDDVDSAAGRVTALLALQSMIGGAPAGRYGVGPGATSVTVPQ